MVRHGTPVVGVMGNNGIWALEKHPMEALYGYSVAAERPALVNVLTDPSVAYPRRSNLA
jgi:acetolactate synthase-1/2/3 large subunit